MKPAVLPGLFDQGPLRPVPETPRQQEFARLNGQQTKLLAFLCERRGQWVTNVALRDVAGLRYGGRLWELRERGWIIETDPVIYAHGLRRYRLTGHKDWNRASAGA